ncbi:MAG: hypothetical protein SVV67_04225 [Bacillota bacterium]|nr:hypothetical protein [Bacillota bacterium]
MRLLKNESGLAMPLVMIVMVVLTLLGIALWNYSTSELNQSVREEKRARAYYIARAGAESMGRHIMVNPDILEEIPEINDIITSENIDFDIANFDPDLADDIHVGELLVTMEKVDENRVMITGIGTVDDINQDVSLILETQEPFDGVVYSLGSMDFHQHVYLEGDIVSGGKVNPPTNFVGTIKEDTQIVFPPPDPDFTPVPNYTENLTIKNNETVIITETPTAAYEKINIKNGGTMVVDAVGASGPIHLEVKDFDMNNGSFLQLNVDANNSIVIVADTMILKDVKLTGSGTAYIYVRSSLNVQTPHADIAPEAYLVVYLDQGAMMELQANSQFEGLLYGPEATVEVGGNADFTGAMIVEQLKGSGGGSSIGAADTDIIKKYSWDILDIDYGGYWMVHWVR